MSAQEPFIGLTDVEREILNAIGKRIHAANRAKGFTGDEEVHCPNCHTEFTRKNPYVIERRLILAIGELVEAYEEIRAGHGPREVYYSDVSDTAMPKPEGYPVEVVDSIIRDFDALGAEELNIGDLVDEKLRFNASRAFKHGKKF